MNGQATAAPRRIDAASIRSIPSKVAMDALSRCLAEGYPETPPRLHLEIANGVLLTMPSAAAWATGVKVVTVAPGNRERGFPLVQGSFLMFDAETSAPVALLDAAALTELRTAALTAVVSRAVVAADASRLVLFGAGAQARAHLDALLSIFELTSVQVVDPVEKRAEDLAARARQAGVAAAAAADPGAVADADIICTCTTSDVPLFDGTLLRSGAHVNAIGAFQPEARELDDATIRRARIVVETRDVAMAEAGDLLIPLREGVIPPTQIVAEVPDLLTDGAMDGAGDVTVYKSVGHAFEDLVVAAAVLAAIGDDCGRDGSE